MLNHATPKERDLLRRLAAKVHEAAISETNLERVRLAKRTNALQAERPLLLTHPENAWNEIIPETSLECSDPVLRTFERQLKQRVFWAEEIKCDRSLYPYLEIPWKIGWGDGWGVEIKKETAGRQVGASYGWSHDFPIKDIAADLPKLHLRRPSVDREGTLSEVELANALFGDLLPARVHWETYWWTFGLTINVIDFVGLENLMMLFYDDPDGVHALMRFFRDDSINMLNWFEREGLLHDNCDADNVGSGGAGHTDALPQPGRPEDAPVKLMDMWGFSESQETVGVGADMFAEFVLPYQAEIAQKFGLNYYGCCEPLHERFKHVRQAIPRLRRVSVAPWTDVASMVEQAGRDYVLCRKPMPTPVAGPTFNEPEIRKEFQETLKLAGHLNLEFIIKDTHTINHEPWRIGRWVEIGREEVARYMETRG
jgi:hypothetical protein